MQIFDMFGEELEVDDMVARAYSSGYSAAVEIVYIDKVPDDPKKRMRVRDVRPNWRGTIDTSNVEYNQYRLIKLSQEQINAAIR